MTTIYKYRYFCTGEQDYVYEWSETTPTNCRLDNSAITNIKIIEKREPDFITIKEEDVQTGGNFQTRCNFICATGPTGTIFIKDFVFPYDKSILNTQLITKGCQEGDYFNLLVAPNTPIGYLTQSTITGATILNVTNSVTTNIKNGYGIKVTNGIITNDGGEVINVDSASGTIQIDTPLTNTFSNTLPTGIILQTIYMSKEFYLPPDGRYPLGLGKIGASYLPANRTVRFEYHKTTAEDNKLWIIVESLY